MLSTKLFRKYEGGGQDVNSLCMCVCVVCSGGTSSDSSKIKQDAFCNFDMMYLPSFSNLPPPPAKFNVIKKDH